MECCLKRGGHQAGHFVNADIDNRAYGVSMLGEDGLIHSLDCVPPSMSHAAREKREGGVVVEETDGGLKVLAIDGLEIGVER